MESCNDLYINESFEVSHHECFLYTVFNGIAVIDTGISVCAKFLDQMIYDSDQRSYRDVGEALWKSGKVPRCCPEEVSVQAES